MDWNAIGTALGALVLGVGSFVMGRGKRRVEGAEADANIDLLTGLVERVKMLENAQGQLTLRLEEEIKSRMQAQEAAHRLRLRVMSLESAMRQVGAVIPPEPQEIPK